MSGRKSRNKGANFERAIAKRLREWLGEDWTVKRNPTDRQNGVAGAGEFELVGPFPFPFAIECKAHESFDYSQLFRRPLTGPLSGFWSQAMSQAQSCGKRPLLLLKRNNGPILAVAEIDTLRGVGILAESSCVMRLYDLGCCVFPAEDLFGTCPAVLYEIE